MSRASLVAQSVKNLPAIQETTCSTGDLGLPPGSGRSPGKGNGNLSSILAWEIPWAEKPCGLQSTGSQKSGMTQRLNHTTISVTPLSEERTSEFTSRCSDITWVKLLTHIKTQDTSWVASGFPELWNKVKNRWSRIISRVDDYLKLTLS